MGDKLENLIEEIIGLDEFWSANYYMSCMKKLPHGGVVNIIGPNQYLKGLGKETSNLFIRDIKVPYWMESIVNNTLDRMLSSQVDINEILTFCFDSDYWYVGFRILKPKQKYESNPCILWMVIENKLDFTEYFIIDKQLVAYAFVCYLIEVNMICISSLDEIKDHEKLVVNHNKYGLSKIEAANFGRQGFVMNELYYLYPLFLDLSIGGPLDNVPYSIKIIQDEIKDSDFRIRMDDNLSVPENDMIVTASTDFQVFRGIEFKLNNIEELVYKKEIIVHICLETLNKLIMIIKKDSDKYGDFYHIEVEELWSKESVRDNIVLTNFIHAKYYPAEKTFKHIDFTVNQYEAQVYNDKYDDMVNVTGVPVDKYAMIHYKIWCVEADSIKSSTWSKIVAVTLNYPFRKLYNEIISISE